MIALLTGAVMFALGLFFGWLLHRERVERALYEDAVRARDRANTTLAETAARLELANKDVIRLREQLTDAQHRVEARDDAIAELAAEVEAERTRTEIAITPEVAELAVDEIGVADDLGEVRDGLVATPGRRTTGARKTGPPDAQLFDELDLDGDIDITEEVAVAPPSGPGAAVDSAEGDVATGDDSGATAGDDTGGDIDAMAGEATDSDATAHDATDDDATAHDAADDATADDAAADIDSGAETPDGQPDDAAAATGDDSGATAGGDIDAMAGEATDSDATADDAAADIDSGAETPDGQPDDAAAASDDDSGATAGGDIDAMAGEATDSDATDDDVTAHDATDDDVTAHDATDDDATADDATADDATADDAAADTDAAADDAAADTDAAADDAAADTDAADTDAAADDAADDAAADTDAADIDSGAETPDGRPDDAAVAEADARATTVADPVDDLSPIGDRTVRAGTAIIADAPVAGDDEGSGELAPDSGIGEPLVMEPEIAGIPDIAGVPAPSASGDAAGDAVVDLTETDAADSTPPMPDDLQQISGVGPALERSLHEQGITSFRQLALLDETDIAELRSRSPRLATRLRRNSWVSQARRLHIDTHGDEP